MKIQLRAFNREKSYYEENGDREGFSSKHLVNKKFGQPTIENQPNSWRNKKKKQSHSAARRVCLDKHTHARTHREKTLQFYSWSRWLHLTRHLRSSPFPVSRFSNARVPRSPERSRFRPMPPAIQHVPFIRPSKRAHLFTSCVFRRLSPLHRGVLSLLFSSLVRHSLRSERESKKETTFRAWQIEDEVIDGSNHAWACGGWKSRERRGFSLEEGDSSLEQWTQMFKNWCLERKKSC